MGMTTTVNTCQTLTRTPFYHAEFHEQAGCAGSGEDGNQKVQLQEQGTPGGELWGSGHTQQQLHVWLCHLPWEVHRRRGNGRGQTHPGWGWGRQVSRNTQALAGQGPVFISNSSAGAEVSNACVSRGWPETFWILFPHKRGWPWCRHTLQKTQLNVGDFASWSEVYERPEDVWF